MAAVAAFKATALAVLLCASAIPVARADATNDGMYVNWWDASTTVGSTVVDAQNVHNGTLVGAYVADPSEFVDGRPAVRSTTDAQYARVTLTPEPQYPVPQFSVSFWFRVESLEWMTTPGTRRTLLSHGVFPNALDVHLIADPSSGALRLRTVYRIDAFLHPETIVTGQWYWYVLSVDTAAATASAFVNAVASFEQRPLSFFNRPFVTLAGNLAWGGRETTGQYQQATQFPIPAGNVTLRDLKIRRAALCLQQVAALFPTDTKDIALQGVTCTAATPAPPTGFNKLYVRIQQPPFQLGLMFNGITPTAPLDGRLYMPAISMAVAFALNNDTIYVGPGTYVDAINPNIIGNKALFSIVGEQGPDSTFWECPPVPSNPILFQINNGMGATLRGMTIRKCINRGSSPVFDVSAASLTMDHVNLANISNPVGVSALLIRGSTLLMRDCTATGVVGPTPGFIFRFSQVTIENSRFYDNGNSATLAVYFGLFDVRQQNVVTFRNSSIVNCATMVQPVFLMALKDVSDTAGPSLVTFAAGSLIANNRAVGAAAFVHSEKGNMAIVDSTVQDNGAQDHVVFYFAKDTQLTFTNATVRRNYAGRSGPIQVREAASLTIRNSLFTQNSARANGGAVYLQEGAVGLIEDTTFSNNVASNVGGAFHADTAVQLTINRSNFTGNRATNGGATSIMDAVAVTLTQCNFNSNYALDVGGASIIQGTVQGTPVFRGTAVHFTSNTARHDAGAMMINIIVSAPPGVYNVDLQDALFSKNTGGDSTGAFLAKGLAVVRFRRSSFLGNTARAYAGAVRVTDQVLSMLDRVDFTGNTASLSGGAVLLDTASVTTMKNSSFSNNNAGIGGAIAMQMAADVVSGSLTVLETSFANNTAQTTGGAIAQENGALVLNNTIFAQNAVVQLDALRGDLLAIVSAQQDGGGAIYSSLKSPTSTLHVAKTNFTANGAAKGVGGAVLLLHPPGDARATFQRCLFAENSAALGAVVHVANPRAPAVDLSNSVVVANTAALSSTDGDRVTTGVHTIAFSVSTLPQVFSGDKISAFAASLYDATGPASSNGELFQLSLARSDGGAASGSVKLHGDLLRASSHGTLQLSDLEIHAAPGSYVLSVNLTSDPMVGSSIGLVVLPCPMDDNHVMQPDADGIQVCVAFRTDYERNRGLLIAVAVLCALGICLALGIAIALFYFDDDRVIKASQPRFLYVIIVGALVAYVGLILDIPDPTDSLCVAQNWMWHVSFALIYAPLFTKTWRVKKIFTNKDLTLKLNLSDRHLMGFVLVTLVTVCTVLAIWTGVRPQFVETVPDGSNVLLQYSECSVNTSWTAITWAVEGIFVLWGCMLAYETRAIPDNFNESRFLAFAVWNYFVINMVVLPISLVITNNPNAQFVLRTLSLFLSPTVVLCVYFIPRFATIYGERFSKPEEGVSDVSEARYIGSKPDRRTSVSSMGRTYSTRSTNSDKMTSLSDSRDSGFLNGSQNSTHSKSEAPAENGDAHEMRQVASIAVDIIPEVDES